MRTLEVELSLADLQEALLDYCLKKGVPQPDCVTVNSHGPKMAIDLRPNGLVDCQEFRHRA